MHGHGWRRVVGGVGEQALLLPVLGPGDAADGDVDAAGLDAAEHAVEVGQLRLDLETEVLRGGVEDVAVESAELVRFERGVRRVRLHRDLDDTGVDRVQTCRLGGDITTSRTGHQRGDADAAGQTETDSSGETVQAHRVTFS